MKDNGTPATDVIELDDDAIAELPHDDPNRVADDSHDVADQLGDFAPDDNEEV